MPYGIQQVIYTIKYLIDRWSCDLDLQLEKSWANFKRENRLSVRYAKQYARSAYCHFFFFAYLTWSEATLAKLSMTLKIKAKKVAV
jgi:nuclear transport factor 2 (NTF2) superfamily protein